MLSLLVLSACDNAPQLVVDGELLTGTRVDEGAMFLGVPFAEPPVGNLRWRAPQPLATRVAQRDATHFAPACMQTTRILDWYRDMAEIFGASRDVYEDVEFSEDCLYLNVWTPTLDTDAQLPVMVWVHGGSNESGWSYEPNYRGDVLAPQGVVVVTVAYRQGAFGFLSHPDLAGEDAVANFGLWDLVAALHWVKDHVRKFGGDADRVTMFGESAGAEDILALLFSDEAKGLFHRAILQSTAGYGQSMPTLYDEQVRGADLGDTLGASSIEQLRHIRAGTLLKTYSAAFADHYHSPAVDGQLVTESTWQSVLSGQRPEVPVIIGANADEYPERVDTVQNFLCPSQAFAATRTASGADTWMYYFSRVRQDAGGEQLGAYHGAEIPYVFGTHDEYMTTTSQDLALGATMQRYWTNFAASGDPNGEGLPAWPAFRRPDARLMAFGDDVGLTPEVEAESCAAMDEPAGGG